MKDNFLKILLLFLLAPSVAFAISLDQAKSKGLVGEMANGYLGVVSSTPEVESLVKTKNSERRAAYEKIASKNGTSVAVVEALAAKKAIQNTPPGQFVQSQSGEWRRK